MNSRRLSVWPPLPPDAYVRPPAAHLPFPLDEPECRLYVRARHGLWRGLGALEFRSGDEILVPAYHHGSEVEAITRAGLACRFYDGGPGLEPDENELNSLVRPTVRALYLIHYLGFPQDVLRWRRWSEARGLLLIEDAAQAWLAQTEGHPVGSFGDLSIFSLYKTFGLPEGAALYSKSPPPPAERSGPVLLAPLAKWHAAWFMSKVPALARLDRNGPPSGYSAEQDFALGDPDTGPSSTTLFLLARLADRRAAAVRRANYAQLLDELADHTPAPFNVLHEGASPFAFPIETAGKARALDRLRHHGIRAMDLWSVAHPSLRASAFPKASERRSRTIALPVHQELEPSDLERMIRAVRRRRAARPQFDLEPVPLSSWVREEWTTLAQSSRNIFLTWEWLSTWWRHLGQDRELFVTACRSRSGQLLAILPLYVSQTGPLRFVRFLGHSVADEMGPVCAEDNRLVAARALRQALREASSRWDVFLGELMPADEPSWSVLLGATVVARHRSPVLRFDHQSWEELLALRSPNLRSQVRRKERVLAGRHELRFRLATDPSALQDDLDTLFLLHEARWTEGSSVFSEMEDFHREFAALALDRGWLRLWFMELEGRAVAAWYGFRFGGVESYYQAGRDTTWDRSSVGFILLAHTIRAALEDGAAEYRFLRGGEPYKYRFATSDAGLETITLGHGVRGVGAVAVAEALAAHGSLRTFMRRHV